MLKAISIVLVAFLIGLGINGSSQKVPKAPPDLRKGPVVRLYLDTGDGTMHNFCSGTVISNMYILTAAHCVASLPPFTMIEIRGDDQVSVGTFAVPIGANGRADVAVLMGAFHGFKRLRMSKGASHTMENFLDNKRPTRACGYPWGAELTCVQITDKHFTIFYESIMGVSGKGWLLPGMSGGPVIDELTQEVVGVNTGTEKDYVFFGTAAGVAEMFHLNPEHL